MVLVLRFIQLIAGVVLLGISFLAPGFWYASFLGIFIILWAAKDIYDELKDSDETGDVQKMEEKRDEIRKKLEEKNE